MRKNWSLLQKKKIIRIVLWGIRSCAKASVIHLSDTLWLKTGCEGTRQELITIWEDLRKLRAFGSVKEECKLCYWIDTTDRVLRNRGEEKEFWMKLRFSGSSVHPDKTRVWDLDAEEWCQNNYFICIILKHLQYK